MVIHVATLAPASPSDQKLCYQQVKPCQCWGSQPRQVEEALQGYHHLLLSWPSTVPRKAAPAGYGHGSSTKEPSVPCAPPHGYGVWPSSHKSNCEMCPNGCPKPPRNGRSTPRRPWRSAPRLPWKTRPRWKLATAPSMPWRPSRRLTPRRATSPVESHPSEDQQMVHHVFQGEKSLAAIRVWSLLGYPLIIQHCFVFHWSQFPFIIHELVFICNLFSSEQLNFFLQYETLHGYPPC